MSDELPSREEMAEFLRLAGVYLHGLRKITKRPDDAYAQTDHRGSREKLERGFRGLRADAWDPGTPFSNAFDASWRIMKAILTDDLGQVEDAFTELKDAMALWPESLTPKATPGKRIKAPGPNANRNRLVHEMASAGASDKEIMAEVDRHSDWRKLGSSQAITSALNTHHKVHPESPIPVRREHKPSKRK